MPLSNIEQEILGLLSGKADQYGLELVRNSSILKRGTVYVMLQRMEKKGLVSSREEKEETMPGLPRRIYSITGLGQQALRAQRAAAAAWDAAWKEA